MRGTWLWQAVERPAAGVLGKCRASLSRGRRQRALDEKRERVAELLRLALRIVEDRSMNSRAFVTGLGAVLVVPLVAAEQQPRKMPRTDVTNCSSARGAPSYDLTFRFSLTARRCERGQK